MKGTANAAPFFLFASRNIFQNCLIIARKNAIIEASKRTPRNTRKERATMKIAIEQEQALLYTPYNPDFVRRVKTIGGARWDAKNRVWRIPVEAVDQARQIMKSFFNAYNPSAFSITHQAGKSNMKYALGILNAGGERFVVTIFVNCRNDSFEIQQLKIERVE